MLIWTIFIYYVVRFKPKYKGRLSQQQGTPFQDVKNFFYNFFIYWLSGAFLVVRSSVTH